MSISLLAEPAQYISWLLHRLDIIQPTRISHDGEAHPPTSARYVGQLAGEHTHKFKVPDAFVNFSCKRHQHIIPEIQRNVHNLYCSCGPYSLACNNTHSTFTTCAICTCSLLVRVCLIHQIKLLIWQLHAMFTHRISKFCATAKED